MNTNILATCLGLLAACLTVSTTVAAADNCAGYTVEVGDRSIVVNDNADEPGHPAIGSCKTGNGMSGTCTYRDRDNDEYTLEWRSVPGTVGRATWEHVGGTGRWTNVRSTGWTRSVMVDRDVKVSRWGGDCTKTTAK